MANADQIDAIWAEDRLDRREEAEHLIAYMTAMSARATGREDAHSLTLALDAGYGEGKTFFLKRLERQLALSHPVAYVDAWADDLTDDPLTALAATLQRALKPITDHVADAETPTGTVRAAARGVMSTLGKVASIAARGVARRGMGLIITDAAADTIGEVMADLPEETQRIAEKAVGQTGKDVVDGVEDAFAAEGKTDILTQRIAAFEQGQAAVRAFKDELQALVDALDGTSFKPPIFIIIDELDRCRPSYAIKLIEEVKHLFDIPGLVFILGMNMEQFARSLGAPYGEKFDGHAYLRRFIGRAYELSKPTLEELIDLELERVALDKTRLIFPSTFDGYQAQKRHTVGQFIGTYMRAMKLTARDVFQMVNYIETASMLTGQAPLFLPYLLPVIVKEMMCKDSEQNPIQNASFPSDFRLCAAGGMRRKISGLGAIEYYESLLSLGQMPRAELQSAANDEDGCALRLLESQKWALDHGELVDIVRYPELVKRLSDYKSSESG